jgi:hypothetical protein
MVARDYLIAYGYVLDADGKYRQHGRRTQVWQELPDGKGWLRFDTDLTGREVPEVYRMNSVYRGVSGLSKLSHPSAFEWVWPEERVEEIYRNAVNERQILAAEAVARKGQGPTPIALPTEVAPTEDQMASMQNEQVGQAATRAPVGASENRGFWDRLLNG